MKNRERQRENRKQKQQEELLEKRNCMGYKDLTAYNAVAKIKYGKKTAIIMK